MGFAPDGLRAELGLDGWSRRVGPWWVTIQAEEPTTEPDSPDGPGCRSQAHFPHRSLVMGVDFVQILQEVADVHAEMSPICA